MARRAVSRTQIVDLGAKIPCDELGELCLNLKHTSDKGESVRLGYESDAWQNGSTTDCRLVVNVLLCTCRLTGDFVRCVAHTTEISHSW